MRKPIKHVREHAKRHEQEHQHLKGLMSKTVYSEKLMGWFLGTFVITLASLAVFFNWGYITSFFTEPENEAQNQAIEETLSKVKGFEIGTTASQFINGEIVNEYLKYIENIRVNGYQKGISTSKILAKGEEKTDLDRIRTYRNSLIFSYSLGNGEHLTANRMASSTLQKSLITSYYLGEKTAVIHSILKNDAELLSKISNAYKVDIFAYLNQSVNRADSLDNYLGLLQTLQEKALQRSSELQSQISFLSGNFEAQERSIALTEEAFFQSLQMFNGDNADEQLTDFIGMQQQQSEIRAKVGAYQKLKDYYDFFLPLLDNLIRAVTANRDPLIAGVKVVEIENMQLPIIIREE